MNAFPKFYGKYRGIVKNNLDPTQLGKIQVLVPSVLSQAVWALPCFPYDGFFAVPTNGTNVWVEFEGGDIQYPIWTGCFWEERQKLDVPGRGNPMASVIKTKSISLTMEEQGASPGLTIRVEPPVVQAPLTLKFSAQGISIDNAPAKVAVTNTGIEISLGAQSIKVAPAGININNGALEII